MAVVLVILTDHCGSLGTKLLLDLAQAFATLDEVTTAEGRAACGRASFLCACRQVLEVQSMRDDNGNCLFEPAALVHAIGEVVGSHML